MKRNAKINSRKLSLICLVLTLVIAMTAIFVVTASAADGTWELVTNVSELAAGDKVIIAAKDSAVALGTTQNNNNRNQAAITKNGNTVTFSSGVQELTLEEGTVAGSFAFNTGSGYLYAASSSKNYLRTETTKSANSSWVITIDNAGTATVKAQGTNTRNLMQYNKSSSIFASYSGAQQSIVIYKFHAASAPVVPDCEHPNKTTTTIPADCTTAGSTKVVCTDCGFEISNTEIPALGHNYVDGFCSRCDEAEPESYEGRYYIATKRSSGNYFYMNNSLGSASTERYQAVDSGLTTLPTFIDTNTALSNQIFVLVRNNDGTYKIYAEGLPSSNYLGWSSGNSGTLVAESSAKNLTVAKKDDGTFNISFDSRYLSLNGTSGNNYFAWYEGTQRQDLTLIPVVEPEPEAPECDHAPKLDYANVNLGQSLALKYYVELCEHANVADYTMKFTMNGVEITVSAEAEKYNGFYVFTLGGIAPQCMGDEIVAELIYEGTAALTKTYSVKQNLIDLLDDPANADDNELMTLIHNTLAYGAEAQKYTGYKTDALVNAGYEEGATQNAQPADAHVLSALKDGAAASFKSAAVEFGDINKIIVKINVADAANVTLKVGETALTLTKVSDGVYAATTDAISALNLGAKVGFNLYVGEDLVQTLTYSVNDYASRKWDDAEMGALVKALYNYGVAATAFAN